ncbi:hypothetical protein [Pedobacter sp.]|uniref:hypothetical protein n=1 Tax=Pedobacter sp. TaxID=1411316 RepID=UPI00396C6965
MVRLFKRKSKSAVQQTPGIFSRAYSYLREWWVRWMKIATAEMTAKNWIFLTVLLVIIGSVYNISLIVQAINSRGEKQLLKVKRIELPENSTKTGDGEPYRKSDTNYTEQKLNRKDYGERKKNN